MFKHCLLLGAILLLITPGYFCYSTTVESVGNMPAQWPWKAVTYDELGSSPERLSVLKKELGINAVLLYLQPRETANKYSLTEAEALKNSLAWADIQLDECKRLGIVAVLNINSFPLNPSKKYNQTSPQFWKSKEDLANVVQLVGRIAERFASRGSELVGYQFISEPLVSTFKQNRIPARWSDLLMQNIRAIRAHDRDRWILVDPGPGGLMRGYKKFDRINDPKIIYDGHMYSPHEFTHQRVHGRPLGGAYPGQFDWAHVDQQYLRDSIKDLREFQLREKVPVLIGEFSAVRWAEGAEKYLEDLADIFDEYGWSWSYHSGNGWHGWNPDYNQNYPGPDTDEKKWRKDFVGLGSVRWQTLKKIFKKHEIEQLFYRDF